MSNPRFFPLMKVRGARRRRIAPIQRVTGSVDRLAESFVALNAAAAAFRTIRMTKAEETSV